MRMLCIDVYWRIIEVIDISVLCFCWLFSCPIVPGKSVYHMNSGAELHGAGDMEPMEPQ